MFEEIHIVNLSKLVIQLSGNNEVFNQRMRYSSGRELVKHSVRGESYWDNIFIFVIKILAISIFC